MRLLGFLRGHLTAVLSVFALLVVLAFCDLALPGYTAKIVDVGIQDGGIENVSPSELTAQTYGLLEALVDPADRELLSVSYEDRGSNVLGLTEEGLAQRAELDEVLTLPLALLASADDPVQEELAGAIGRFVAGELSAKDLRAAAAPAAERLASPRPGDPSAERLAVLTTRAEYQHLGYDLEEMQMGYLKQTGLAMIGLAALAMAINVAVSLIASRTGAGIARDLRSRLYAKVLSFSDSEVGEFSTASLITRCTNDVQLVQMVSIMLLRMVAYCPILCIGGIVMVARTCISMAWVVFLAVVVVLAVTATLMAVATPKFLLMQKLVDKVNLVSREILTGLPVIRAFCREKHEEERFAQVNGELMRTQLFTNRIMAFMMPSMMLVMNLASVAIVWVGGGYVDSGAIQTGDLIAFITYSTLVVSCFLMFGMISIMLPRANVAAGRICEVLSCEPRVGDAPDTAAADERLAGEGGVRVEFDDVTFAYGPASGNVLEHVSFVARPGETLAIVGATGSGKTTILKLIERFYDVGSGRVLVDGVDVRECSQEALRRVFGYVPQRAFLFGGTVGSNLSFADEEMDAGRKRLALEVSQAAEFIDVDQGGLEAPVAQGGSNVSGGQRQRLAIARALAADARCYLFDDSFSALDYKTDAALRRGLATRLAGKTIIVVAQRIATVMHADRIVVLDGGAVVGQGTHEELLRTCPAYLEIAQSQLSEDEISQGGERR